MKKIFLYIAIFFCIFSQVSAAATKEKIYSEKQGYLGYKENVKSICADRYKGQSELIYRIDETNSFTNVNSKGLNSEQELQKAQKEYLKNMDDIYACANSVTTFKSIDLILDKLINKNAPLNARLKSQLEQKKKHIQSQVQKLDGECKIESTSGTSNLIKKSVLDQTSYELCRYTFYLEYLYERADLLENKITEADKKGETEGVSISEVVNSINNSKNDIIAEQNDALRIFPIAYKAYADYENNIGPHIMLELLKEDYIILREQLHKTLNPLSLLGYKLKNAMKR